MSWKTKLLKYTKILGRKPPRVQTRGIGSAIAQKTPDSNAGLYFSPILARANVQRSLKDLSEEVLNTLSDDQVRSLISRASPIVSKAVKDYADAISAGISWTADRTQEPNVDTPQRRLLSEFLEKLELDGNSIEKIIGEFGRSMFIYGGAFAELVIAEDQRTPLLLKTLDASTVRFIKRRDPILGEIYILGQERTAFTDSDIARETDSDSGFNSTNFRSFQNEETIQYLPIDSEPNNPYGTPILDPAIFHVILMAGFFDSFNQAIKGHIWPNLHITLDPELFRQGQEALGEGDLATNDQIDSIQKKYENSQGEIVENIKKLEPGNALLTPPYVQIGGTIAGGSQARSPLGSIKDLQDVIRRELILAVKSQPILMGSNEAVAETHAIEQRRDYGELIRSGQKVLAPFVTKFFNLILRLNGYPPLAVFTLSYFNTADYKDRAATFSSFRQGLLTASQDLQQFVLALETAVEAEYLTPQQAQEMFEEGMEIRRQLSILPQDL